MTFNEAMQELLKGKKVRRVKWAIKEDYITLATSGYIVCKGSQKFNPNTDDITGDWEEYHSLKPGSRFAKDGQIYRVVSINSSLSINPSRWGLINTEKWDVVYEARTLNELENRISSLGDSTARLERRTSYDF